MEQNCQQRFRFASSENHMMASLYTHSYALKIKTEVGYFTAYDEQACRIRSIYCFTVKRTSMRRSVVQVFSKKSHKALLNFKQYLQSCKKTLV